jgi:hypothetical protein
MTTAEQRIAALLNDYLDRVLLRWTGYEKILLFELARALDDAAFGLMLLAAPESAGAHRTVLLGSAPAMRPLLERVRGVAGGVPWGPSSRELSALADSHLHYSGRLANLVRLAALERYGLASVTYPRPDHLVLEIASGDIEYEDREAVSDIAGGRPEPLFALFPESPDLLRRMDTYVGVEQNGLIRYANDDELVAYYRAVAADRAKKFLEGEALPPDAVIGGRTFARWLDAVIAASGRILQHIAFATRLASLRPDLMLRHLLTLFVRRQDLHNVLVEAGEPPTFAVELVRALTLDSDAAAACLADHEIPNPFYIDFGRDFVLLPCTGALLNPVAAVVKFLRSQYRTDWDRAVARREEVFRDEVRSLFSEPAFHVPSSGVRLQRADGSTLTDIDAVVLDRACGGIALLQLKWHDIYGRSLKERNSRRSNLLGANKWVERVSQWVDGRSAGAIAAALKVGSASEDRPPQIFVVSRYAAQFVGQPLFDARAGWIGWGDLTGAFLRSENDPPRDFFGDLLSECRGGRKAPVTRSEPQVETFEYPSLSIEVRVQ